MSTGVPQAGLELIRSAVHEAGHAAVCLHFGVEFDQVTIRQFDGEVSRRLSESDQRSMSQAARKEIVIALAGAAAQRLFYPDQPEAESFFCSQDDQAYVTKIISNPEYRISEAYRKEADADAWRRGGGAGDADAHVV